MSFIEIENLDFSYEADDNGKKQVLHGIDLKIEKGEYIAILGHNGSGKSTLARLITMIEDTDGMTGRIIIDGVDISDENMTEEQMFAQRRKVGMVFQNPDNQLVATIVEDDVAFGPENLGIPREEIRERVDRALETVGMTQYAKHEPHRLSGGQKQRVAIAGIIAMTPDCIIFDESTAMLDPAGRDEIVRTMETLNREQGITVVNITHYMDEAARADRIIVLNDGYIVCDGSPAEVFAQTDKLTEAGLELPQYTKLLKVLIDHGFDLPADISGIDACADAIEKLYRRNGGAL